MFLGWAVYICCGLFYFSSEEQHLVNFVIVSNVIGNSYLLVQWMFFTLISFLNLILDAMTDDSNYLIQIYKILTSKFL